jgi:hypothetical protein
MHVSVLGRVLIGKDLLFSCSQIDRKEIRQATRAATPATMMVALVSLLPEPEGSDSSPIVRIGACVDMANMVCLSFVVVLPKHLATHALDKGNRHNCVPREVYRTGSR